LIRFFKKGQQVICEIDDNGVGIQRAMKNKEESLTIHHSLGIANIKERLQVLNEKYQMNCSLQIKDKGELPFIKDSGTLAVLHLSV
jgi:sensor histidine kinase YesM